MTDTITNNIIDIDRLQFRWKPKAPLVLDIERLQVAKAERLFLCGPSGSGKSSLLNLVAGVVLAESGKITVAGTELSSLSGPQRDRFRADTIGFIFQMFNLIPYLSVVENVLLGLSFARGRKKALAAKGQARAEAIRLLQALQLDEALFSRSVGQLSIGQQQRVAAARAMLASPPLLIADEPSSALDADTRESFITLLFEECERSGMTLLFVSHDASLQPLFDRTIALTDINRVKTSPNRVLR